VPPLPLQAHFCLGKYRCRRRLGIPDNKTAMKTAHMNESIGHMENLAAGNSKHGQVTPKDATIDRQGIFDRVAWKFSIPIFCG
jgi:hypothetical protein